MATHTDTKAVIDYNPGNYPTLGNDERFIANELDKIRRSIRKLNDVVQLLEARMNTNGLT